MTSRSLNILIASVMLAIFAIFVGVAATYPEDARFMPFVVGIPAIFLCILQLVIELRRKPVIEEAGESNVLASAERRVAQMTGREMHFDVAHDTSIPQEEHFTGIEEERREKILWVAFIGVIAGVVLFGFNITIPVFMILFLRFMAGFGWAKAALAGAFASAFMLGIFEWGLRSDLYPGMVTEWIKSLMGG